jgi:hypothetical protein
MLSYMMSVAPSWKYRLVELGEGCPDCPLGSWASMWLVPGMVLGVSTASLHLAWLLSLPM